MKKKLVIHPGIGKTATSAIQHQLFRHSYSESGDSVFIYPNIGLDNENAHHYFADNFPGYSEKKLEEYFKFFEDKLESIDVNKNCIFIISSEFLIYSSREHIDYLITRFKCIFDNIEILFSIRNYTDLIYSSYLQAVKVNYGIENGESIIDYYRRMGNGFDFSLLLEKFNKADSIKYIDYDKHKNNFVGYFLSSIGFDINELSLNITKDNLSIIEDVVGIIFKFDEKNEDIERRKKFISNMLTFSNNYKNFSSKSMKEILRKEISDRYENDISIMRDKYIEV